ncbi:reticulon-4-interacting protein [Metarhizium guizhouense ARSEF 977]|uniref:Reticulon-4-interacting protein n=1 Tax=Metarhizium guizhouense (strain ARSEF 977) TaxID=1276136 RepID=A0A0B4I275_METGA|nr:reticulon-4-interacting protein [Metarhizium guizhouense ARSEF 977]
MAQPNLPASMRAVRQRDKLTPELALAQTPVPVPSQPADVLVEVAATALCYSELTWARQNPRFFPPDKEPVPGQDMPGTVVQVGPGSSSSSSFKPGDQVFCRIDATRAGGLRDYTLALESELALKPACLIGFARRELPRR